MTDETQIPQRYVNFAREACRLAKKEGLYDMTITISPGFRGEWNNDIVVSWHAGRHEADVDKMTLTSQVVLQTRVEDPLSETPVYRR